MPKLMNIQRNTLGILEYQMESLTRALLTIVQEYLSSELGKRDYTERKVNKDKKGNIEAKNNYINEM